MSDSVLIEVNSEFDFIYRAFEFVAFIFGPEYGYLGLILAVGVAAIMFGAVASITKETLAGKGVIVTWLLTVLLAGTLISFLTLSTTTVMIKDTSSGRMRSISRVPAVMAYLAHMENFIEVKIKDIMVNIMQPVLDYDAIGKGKGFDMLASFDDVGRDYFRKNPYVKRSLADYWNKCVLGDIAMGWIDAEKLTSGTLDIWKELKSDTRSRFSLVFSADAPAGEALACADAYQLIDSSFSDVKMSQILKGKCIQSVSATETADDGVKEQKACLNRFQLMIENLISDDIDSSPTPNGFIRSYLTTWAIASNTGALTTALVEMNKKNASQAFMAEKTLPRLKGMMFGMMIGIFPFLVAFMWLSPAKTLNFYLGMYIMMVLWGAIDTFLDMQYQNEVVGMFAQLRASGLGFSQMFDIPNKSADALALYGQGRWLSLGLATAISSALTGINSYAISQFGGQLSASAQMSAAVSSQFVDTAGQSKLAQQAGAEQAQREFLSDFAGMPNVANSSLNSAYQNVATSWNKADTLANTYGNPLASQHMGGSQAGQVEGQVNMAEALGMTTEQYATFQSNGSIIDENIANKLQDYGFSSEMAQNVKGLKLTDIGRDANGNISNIKASGVNDGKEYEINQSSIMARHTVMNAPETIAGVPIGVGGKVTEIFDKNGELAQLQVEGAGFKRFSMNIADPSQTQGTRNLIDGNGNVHTQEFSGTSMTDTITDKNGQNTVNSYGYSRKDNSWHLIKGVLNGDGYDNAVFQNGMMISGKRTFDLDGVTYTQIADGNTMTTTYMDSAGNNFAEKSIYNNGEYTITQASVVAGEGGFSVNGVDFQKGARWTYDYLGGSSRITGQTALGATTAELNSAGNLSYLAANTGSQQNVYLNSKNVQGLTDMKGMNTSIAELVAGLKNPQFDVERSPADKFAFTKNFADLMNTFSQKTSDSKLSEDEKLQVMGTLETGVKLGLWSAKVQVQASAAVSHSATASDLVDVYKLMSDGVMDKLIERRQSGEFAKLAGSDPNHEIELFNQAGRDAYADLLSIAIENQHAPHSGAAKVGRAAIKMLTTECVLVDAGGGIRPDGTGFTYQHPAHFGNPNFNKIHDPFGLKMQKINPKTLK